METEVTPTLEHYVNLMNAVKAQGVDKLPMEQVWELLPEKEVQAGLLYGCEEGLFTCLPEDYLILDNMKMPA